jgi:hypothetical protein
MKRIPLAVICLSIVGGLLTLGLWPFHAPANDATWLDGGQGLSFGGAGTALSAGTFTLSGEGLSIEIWARAEKPEDGQRTLLTLLEPEGRVQLAVRQFDSDLKLETLEPNRPYRPVASRHYVSDVFGSASILIAITSGHEGTRVYRNGRLLESSPRFRAFNRAFTARVILGDAPGQSEGWEGLIHGLAIYDCELTAVQVLRHYQTWAGNRRPAIAEEERNLALYLIDSPGPEVRNLAGGADLLLPRTYTVVDKTFLRPFWEEINPYSGYWKDLFNNIAGFVPFGFCLFAYLSTMRPARRPVLFTVLLGTLVSLTIEVIQGLALPTRESSTTDLLTNTFGTWIGARLYRPVIPKLTKVLLWLPFPGARGAD